MTEIITDNDKKLSGAQPENSREAAGRDSSDACRSGMTAGQSSAADSGSTVFGGAAFNVFGADYDRFAFPMDIQRVTAGNGGEALLIFGSEKTALYDCGMAYCGRQMVTNLRNALAAHGRDTLDIVLLSHSHYDHIGALPYVKAAFPDAVVYASRHCAEILRRPNARKLIKELGTTARELYDSESTEEIPVEGLAADRVLADGEKISLGRETVTAIETKGHTDCSMSYFFEPCRLLFTSESTGLMENTVHVHTPILKSYSDAMTSLKKCKSCNAEYLSLPHFGMLPEDFSSRYWQMFEEECRSKLEYVRGMKNEGLTEKEMLDRYVEKYWEPVMAQIQPIEAFKINSGAVIKALLRELQTEQQL